MTVPPVPTPATNAAGTRPAVAICIQISGPVVVEVRPHVGLVRELVRQEHARVGRALRVGPSDAAEKPALVATDRHDVGAQAGNEGHPLGAHPVGHEDRYRMAKRAPDRRKRNAGVAAGGFDNAIAGPDAAAGVGVFQHE